MTYQGPLAVEILQRLIRGGSHFRQEFRRDVGFGRGGISFQQSLGLTVGGAGAQGSAGREGEGSIIVVEAKGTGQRKYLARGLSVRKDGQELQYMSGGSVSIK
jgi:hypothetical protein